jgi:hypothetical protein
MLYTCAAIAYSQPAATYRPVQGCDFGRAASGCISASPSLPRGKSECKTRIYTNSEVSLGRGFVIN